MKVPNTTISNLTTVDEIQRYTAISLGSIINVINGNLTFGENLSGSFNSATFTGAGQEQGISHGLKRVPQGYIVVGRSTGITIYNGENANTVSTLYLRSTGVGTISVFVF